MSGIATGRCGLWRRTLFLCCQRDYQCGRRHRVALDVRDRTFAEAGVVGSASAYNVVFGDRNFTWRPEGMIG